MFGIVGGRDPWAVGGQMLRSVGGQCRHGCPTPSLLSTASTVKLVSDVGNPFLSFIGSRPPSTLEDNNDGDPVEVGWGRRARGEGSSPDSPCLGCWSSDPDGLEGT